MKAHNTGAMTMHERAKQQVAELAKTAAALAGETALRVEDQQFDDTSLPTYVMDGQAYWIAADFGRALGYARGRTVTNHIRGKWADELRDGKDYKLLTGKALKALQACDNENMSLARANALMVLTESGAQLVCLLTKKPAGRRMRRWLADDVLPKLRTEGTYTVPQQPEPPPEPVTPALDDLDRKSRVMALALEVAGEAATASVRLRWAEGLMAQEGIPVRQPQATSEFPKSTGRVLPPLTEWHTATDVGRRLGTSANKVGRIAKRLGLQDGHPDVQELMVEANGAPRPVWEYRGEAIELIKHELEASR